MKEDPVEDERTTKEEYWDIIDWQYNESEIISVKVFTGLVVEFR